MHVRAYSVVGGQQSQPGAAGASNSVTPYGPPRAPTGSATNLGTTVRVAWDASGSANGRDITLTQVSIDGGGWQNVALSGSTTVGNGYQQTHSIRVRATDAAGQTAESPTYSARTNDPPQPSAQTVRGDLAVDHGGLNGYSCSKDTCYYVAADVANFPAGNYDVTCYANGSAFSSSYSTQYVPANGRVQATCWTGGNSGGDYNIQLYIRGWGWQGRRTGSDPRGRDARCTLGMGSHPHRGRPGRVVSMERRAGRDRCSTRGSAGAAQGGNRV